MNQAMPKERSYEAPVFKLSTDEPIRIPDPRTMKSEDLKGIFLQIDQTAVEQLVQIREKTYEVLDRIDEILLDGGKVSVEQIDEIICGIAVLEEILLNKLKGLSKDALEKLDAKFGYKN